MDSYYNEKHKLRSKLVVNNHEIPIIFLFAQISSQVTNTVTVIRTVPVGI